MNNRRIDAFFYGLFMDREILCESGIEPFNPRRAYVADFALRIGRRATLVALLGARSYGMAMSVTHQDLERLYEAPGLELYRPEAVLAVGFDGTAWPALCYNLCEAPAPHERNLEYAERLRGVLGKLQFPPEYVSSVS